MGKNLKKLPDKNNCKSSVLFKIIWEVISSEQYVSMFLTCTTLWFWARASDSCFSKLLLWVTNEHKLPGSESPPRGRVTQLNLCPLSSNTNTGSQGLALLSHTASRGRDCTRNYPAGPGPIYLALHVLSYSREIPLWCNSSFAQSVLSWVA